MPSGNKIETKLVVRINGKKIHRSVIISDGVTDGHQAVSHLDQVQRSLAEAVEAGRTALSV